MRRVSRAQAVRYRLAAQGLTAEPDSRSATEVEILDLGVHDTGPHGATWALACRGAQGVATWPSSLTVAWTMRGAPHAYRSRQLAAVARANLPWSHLDASHRVHDAAEPLRAAGVPAGAALSTLAHELRSIVRRRLPKGEVSTRLAARMSEPYVRWCGVCHATHLYEQPFRLAALPAGLVLEPGTSSPVLRPRRHWDPDIATSLAHLPQTSQDASGPIATEHSRHDLLLATLRFFGPLTPHQVADFLDVPLAEVAARWAQLLEDGTLTEVTVTRRSRGSDPVDSEEAGRGQRAMRTADLGNMEGAATSGLVRLVGPYDLFLQGRDRHLLVPDPQRREALWPALGRPGAVLLDGEVIGTWQPRATESRLHVVVDPWTGWRSPVRRAVDEQADLLAHHQNLTFAGLE